MAENSDFATTILTSKLPRDVANFIPHSLDLSQTLIDKNLAVWFSNYTKMLIRYNQDLNLLVANGRDFFTNSGAEFGSIDKIWNCVASCVTSQIALNDALIRVMKNDILAQLTGAVRDDVRFSELVVNSKELTEISRALDSNDPNGEYQWNVKAPAVLSNFENYKRHEKGLLSSSFLNYMNAVNSKTAEMLHKNENAVNYILKEFNVDNEMASYIDYMVHAKVLAPEGGLGVPHASSNRNSVAAASSPLKNRNSRASVSSGLSDTKKKLKLRSKMGSLLGRKKKNEKQAATPVAAIPEDDSASSVPSRQNTSFSTRRSLADQLHQPQPQPQLKPLIERGAFVAPGSAASASGNAASGNGVGSSGIRTQTFSETVPLQPSVPVKKEEPPQPVREEEGPNIVKYTSSDDDSDGPTDAQGNRLSMLQTHQLDHPPKVDADTEDQSRKTSSGKYSFDYGDEEKEISAKATPRVDSASDFPSFGAPPSSGEATQSGLMSNVAPTSATAASIANEVGPPARPPKSYTQENAAPSNEYRQSVLSDAAGFGASSAQTHSQPPPPPPSRKVHTAGENKINRRDLHSGTFQNLPPARELFIQPRMTHEDTGTRTSLVSQNTGNSFFRHDSQFKHFGSSQALVSEGLHTSVAEIINVTYQGGDVTKAQVLGEVAFNYNSTDASRALQEVVIPVQFSKNLLNESFMHQVSDTKYSLDLPQIASRTLGGLKYITNLSETQVPVLVKQVWKFEPHQASLIIKLSHNRAFGELVQLDGLVISASLSSNVESTSASSKPEGSFNREKNRITWRYSQPLELSASRPEEKLIARFQTNGQATEAPTGVQLKFNVVNSPSVYVPILDTEGHSIPSFRSLSTGNYASHA